MRRGELSAMLMPFRQYLDSNDLPVPPERLHVGETNEICDRKQILQEFPFLFVVRTRVSRVREPQFFISGRIKMKAGVKNNLRGGDGGN